MIHPVSFADKVGKSRRVKVEEIQDSWQKEGWLQDTIDHGLIQAYVVSDTEKSGRTWTADVVRPFSRSTDRGST